MTMNSGLAVWNAMRRLPSLLRGSTRRQLAAFVAGQWRPEGACANRFGEPDLYYTSFGLACAEALQAPVSEATAAYVRRQEPAGLDLVHLNCLVRAQLILKRRRLPSFVPPAWIPARLRRVPAAREVARFAHGGGYRTDPSQPETPYAAFLATTALSGAGLPIPGPEALAAGLGRFRTGDGGWSNLPGAAAGSVNATAAAMVAQCECGSPPDRRAIDWLLRQFDTPSGGVHAVEAAPLPDLLSTASALTALHLCGGALPEPQHSRCREMVLDHWNADGGFTGTLADEASDCEYTFYGLLALGILGP